ncbi:unnamed protein product [Lepeophtheirus salmonis]|uniref:(salmon louse) hypothetical protein n=1 Tax=Lepeophtheirus salmonis TaxID=72036 RepID=A0A7R8CJ40_LEPSM|nr:unnamed protein product [Lepeophtheirus salmonis]CAF2801688.1 unnamed protein product [Lepeophtheirus salmonis]
MSKNPLRKGISEEDNEEKIVVNNENGGNKRNKLRDDWLWGKDKIWSEAKVLFVPKLNKENYSNPEAFRPIILAKTIVKGMESIIYLHIESLQLRVPMAKQLGFQRGKSTDSAIAKLVDSDVLNKKYAIVVFF